MKPQLLKMKAIAKVLLVLVLLLTSNNFKTFAQCVWANQFYDGFEYSTACPNVIPSITYTAIPQSYAVHTGTKSLYLNFVDCIGGTGACVGALVYERVVPVCIGLDMRFSAFLTTTFSGAQCNMKITISDANNVILSNTDSVAASYSPVWTSYTSATMVPTTSTITIRMYTNVGGGNGNDLSMDDFKLDQCLTSGINSFTVGVICNNLDTVSLYNKIPNPPITNGTWSGPSVLNGGYLGNFATASSSGGTYIFSSYPYGILAGCPIGKDTIIAIKSNPPLPKLGNDTTICYNSTITLNPKTSVAFNYLWSTGSTSPTISASGPISTSNTYTVTVTDGNGCSNKDTIAVYFDVCNGLSNHSSNEILIAYPNPTTGKITLEINSTNEKSFQISITDIVGREIMKRNVQSIFGKNSIPMDLSSYSRGVYYIQIQDSEARDNLRITVQ